MSDAFARSGWGDESQKGDNDEVTDADMLDAANDTDMLQTGEQHGDDWSDSGFGPRAGGRGGARTPGARAAFRTTSPCGPRAAGPPAGRRGGARRRTGKEEKSQTSGAQALFRTADPSGREANCLRRSGARPVLETANLPGPALGEDKT